MAKTTLASKTVVEADILLDTIQEIENLSESNFLDYLSGVEATGSMCDFKLGGALSMATINGWYKKEAGGNFKVFADFLAVNFPTIGYPKAKGLINMYNAIVNLELNWEDVKDIGWTKLNRLAGVMTTENKDYWLEQARKLNKYELGLLIAASKMPSDVTIHTFDLEQVNPETPLSKISFVVHADEKETIQLAVEKAKQDTGSEYDCVALDAICQNYLGNSPVNKPVVKLDTPVMSADDAKARMHALMNQLGAEDSLNVFGEVFPNIDIVATIT